MSVAIAHPNSERRCRELRSSHKDPLFYVILGICLLFAVPSALVALWGVVQLVTEGKGGILLVCGALMTMLVMAFPAYLIGVNRRAARHLEWMLGAGAAQLDWLYIRRATSKGHTVGHHVVAVVGRSRKFVTAKTRDEAEWILREVMRAAPQAQLDHDGTLIANGLGDRGFGYTEYAPGS